MDKTSYILKRLLLMVPTLLGILFISFLLMKSIPGDPVYSLVGERADQATIEQYRSKMGLNKPFLFQFMHYFSLVLKGDLGVSYYTHQPVGKMLLEKFPNTLKLATFAMLLASLIGILTGIVAAFFQNTFLDRVIVVGSICTVSTPVFWFGLMLIIIFANGLGWFPPAGMGSGISIYIVLPAVTLGIRSAAYITRITRTNMIETSRNNYITTAKAKGLSQASITFKHTLKNAIIPIITLIGIDFGSYLNGSVLTETIFGWDGLGRYAMNGIFKRDYPVILGTVLFGAFVFVLINLIIDISYRLFNPQIGYK
ncbi:ABC transporter permease [Candidatus Auribacterota bacterium]